MSIFATTKREWEMPDASTLPAKHVNVAAGRYELERIPNPTGTSDCNWLVLKGTKTGMAEGAWKRWINGSANVSDFPEVKPMDWEDFEIVLEEDGELVSPV